MQESINMHRTAGCWPPSVCANHDAYRSRLELQVHRFVCAHCCMAVSLPLISEFLTVLIARWTDRYFLLLALSSLSLLHVLHAGFMSQCLRAGLQPPLPPLFSQSPPWLGSSPPMAVAPCTPTRVAANGLLRAPEWSLLRPLHPPHPLHPFFRRVLSSSGVPLDTSRYRPSSHLAADPLHLALAVLGFRICLVERRGPSDRGHAASGPACS